jgi:hypothetical protein
MRWNSCHNRHGSEFDSMTRHLLVAERYFADLTTRYRSLNPFAALVLSKCQPQVRWLMTCGWGVRIPPSIAHCAGAGGLIFLPVRRCQIASYQHCKKARQWREFGDLAGRMNIFILAHPFQSQIPVRCPVSDQWGSHCLVSLLRMPRRSLSGMRSFSRKCAVACLKKMVEATLIS